jgi:hypothetical protein
VQRVRALLVRVALVLLLRVPARPLHGPHLPLFRSALFAAIARSAFIASCARRASFASLRLCVRLRHPPVTGRPCSSAGIVSRTSNFRLCCAFATASAAGVAPRSSSAAALLATAATRSAANSRTRPPSAARRAAIFYALTSASSACASKRAAIAWGGAGAGGSASGAALSLGGSALAFINLLGFAWVIAISLASYHLFHVSARLGPSRPDELPSCAYQDLYSCEGPQEP